MFDYSALQDSEFYKICENYLLWDKLEALSAEDEPLEICGDGAAENPYALKPLFPEENFKSFSIKPEAAIVKKEANLYSQESDNLYSFSAERDFALNRVNGYIDETQGLAVEIFSARRNKVSWDDIQEKFSIDKEVAQRLLGYFSVSDSEGMLAGLCPPSGGSAKSRRLEREMARGDFKIESRTVKW